MASPAFDPNGAVKFDLRNGAASDARGGRLVLVPRGALEALERTHPEALVALGNEIGRTCGARASGRLGGDAGVRGAPLETVVTHIAGELAVAGIGVVHLERWGRAMVIVVTNAVASQAFVGAVLAGALGAAAGRDVGAAFVGNEGTSTRFFIGSRKTAEDVATAVAGGLAFSDVLSDLHGRSS